MWIKTLQVRLQIINTFIVQKERNEHLKSKNIFTDSLEFKHSQKLPLKSPKLFTLWN